MSLSRAPAPEECIAARALLGWPARTLLKRAKLAIKSKLNLNDIVKFEAGRKALGQKELDSIASAFKSAGISFFLNDDGTPRVYCDSERTSGNTAVQSIGNVYQQLKNGNQYRLRHWRC